MARSKKRNSKKPAVQKQPVEAAISYEPDIDGATSMAQEYDYVRKDLSHLVIVSVVLFAVMLGVGFFI